MRKGFIFNLVKLGTGSEAKRTFIIAKLLLRSMYV